MRKRSVTISGHRTSISLEDEFWQELVMIAVSRGMSVNALVTEIDRERKGGLSSAIRLHVLEHAQKRSGRNAEAFSGGP